MSRRLPSSPLFPYTTLFRSILEDTNGDGRADVCKTFAGDLHNPTGFEFWNGGVLVAQGPDLLFLKRSEEHTSELQSHSDLVCRLLLEKKKKTERTRSGPELT